MHDADQTNASSPARRSWLNSSRRTARLVGQPVKGFIDTEASGGILLLVATVVALVWANSPWSASYEQLWSTPVSIQIGNFGIHKDLVHWVNDGLMAVFFFVVGLEIKREWVAGELRDRRAAVLPAAAAIGGMVVPALLYLAITAGTEASSGWGIPMATDIAFALGLVTLLGRRVPTPLKVFLLTLAIVDDIGAILVIALAYSHGLHWTWLAEGAVIVLVVAVLSRLHVVWHPVYLALGVLLWVAVFESGVHATIAGVVMGLLMPAVPSLEPARPSLAEQLEQALHPWTSNVVIPIFALANAGIVLGTGSFPGSRTTVAVVVALVVGKAVGVSGATWLAVRTRLASLPSGVSWGQLFGIAALAGIGFTVSLFITGLAFDAPALQADAKVGILVASVFASSLGAVVLAVLARRGGRAGRRGA